MSAQVITIKLWAYVLEALYWSTWIAGENTLHLLTGHFCLSACESLVPAGVHPSKFHKDIQYIEQVHHVLG